MNDPGHVASRLTPYSDTFPACERCVAELRVYGDALSPEFVSRALGLRPTASHRKGQVSERNALGRTRVAPTGGWFLSSESNIDSKDLRHHLDWLLAQLSPCATRLARLQGDEGIRMRVNCIWWSARRQGGPVLWPEQMRALVDLGLECWFGFGFYGESR